MKPKLIFFDIDGTLLDEETQTIPESTKEAIQQAQNNGHLCFINTGRPRSTIDHIITDLGFDGYICGCGTYVEYQQEVILHVEINKDLQKLVIESSFDYGVEAILEGRQGAFFPENAKHPFVNTMKKRYLAAKFPIYTYTRDDIVPFDKLAVIYDDHAQISDYRQQLSPHFDLIQRDVDFLEIVPHNYSKASGIALIISHLENTLQNTISIGDSTNDLSMLRYTHESIAMGNSHPDLFDIVTYVTKDIKQHGIAHALKHFQVI